MRRRLKVVSASGVSACWILIFFRRRSWSCRSFFFVNGLEIVYQTVRREIYAGPNSRKLVGLVSQKYSKKRNKYVATRYLPTSIVTSSPFLLEIRKHLSFVFFLKRHIAYSFHSLKKCIAMLFEVHTLNLRL